jgi:hypothetical protein
MAGYRQHGRIDQQDVESPRNRSKVNRHYLDVAEKKRFRGYESNQPHPAVNSE